jgi:hypothetical protein
MLNIERGEGCTSCLLNIPELNKVYHSFYNLFLGTIQGVNIGGVSENTLSNIIYRIGVLQELKN